MSVVLAKYSGGAEHLGDELIWLEAGLRALLDAAGDDPLTDPLASVRGLVITRDELSDPALDGAVAAKAAVWQSYTNFRRGIEERIAARAGLGGELPLFRIAAAFKLTVWEYRCVVLCLAVEWDRQYEKWYGYLNDDATCRTATVDLALRLLGDAQEDRLLGRGMLAQGRALRRWLLRPYGSETDEFGQRLKSPLRLDERTVSFLLETEKLDGRLDGYAEAREPEDVPPCLDAAEEEAERALRRIVGDWPKDGMPSIALWGARGGGKRKRLHRLAASRGQRLLVVLLDALPDDAAELRKLLDCVVREALLTNAAICFTEGESGAWQERQPRAAILSAIEEYAKYTQNPLVCWSGHERRSKSDLPLPGGALYWCGEVGAPSAAVRARLWLEHASAFGTELPAEERADYATLTQEMADRFQFTAGQISSAWRQALVHAAGRGAPLPERQDLAAAARSQFRHRLAQHANAIEPRRGWEDLIIPDDSLSLIREACNRFTLREKVLEEWGFGRKLSYGTGVHMLFAGPPGTGKTMAAEVVAAELGLELYRVDLSRIVSKYIGETEQRLRELFDEARQSGAILFFDEGDALFGKRTEVKDAHDRYANMEAAYLLQLIEGYDGVTVLATNFMQNLDEAMLRRMSTIVKFPFPDAADRARIFRAHLPATAPLDDDLDLEFLAARTEVSGGHIKNIVLAAAFLAASEQRPIGMAHMVKAAREELQKLGKIPMKEAFAPYHE